MILDKRQYEVVLANEKGQIHIWDLRNNGNTMHWPDTQAGAINSLAMNAEGNMLAALNSQGVLMVYSIPDNSISKMVPRVRFLCLLEAVLEDVSDAVCRCVRHSIDDRLRWTRSDWSLLLYEYQMGYRINHR